MGNKKIIKLINNERMERIITSAKACALNTADTCRIYAYDMCVKDYSSSCTVLSYDLCIKDYGYCTIYVYDMCAKDYGI